MNLDQRSAAMRDFFNEKADVFDDNHDKYKETKALVTKYLPDGIKNVLDLGGGTGMELVYLFERFPNANVTVIDISENMLEKLKERPFYDRLTIICGDFFKVDMGHDYDAIISTSALHHFTRDDKTRLYKNVLERLKNGGAFINCDKIALSLESERERFDNFDELIKVMKHCDTPLYYETEKAILDEVGFVNTSVNPGGAEDYRLMYAEKA